MILCWIQDLTGGTLFCALSIDYIVYIWPTPLAIVLNETEIFENHEERQILDMYALATPGYRLL